MPVEIAGKVLSGFELTQQFFRSAQESGVDQIVINSFPDNGIARPRFIRDLSWTERYLTTYDPLPEVGKPFNKTGEAVRQAVKRTIARMVQNSPEELRTVFLQDELEIRKPAVLKNRRRLTLSQGGKSLQASRLAQEGKTAEQIMQELNISPRVLNGTRQVLRHWQEPIPGYVSARMELNPLLESKLSQLELDDAQKQRFLGQVRMRFYRTHIKGDNPVLMNVKSVAEQAGFHFRNDQLYKFINQLEQAQLPMGKISTTIKKGPQSGNQHNYHFISTLDKQRAIDIFAAADELQSLRQNPVTQPYGPPAEQLPNTTRLLSPSYLSLRTVFQDANIKPGRKNYQRFMGPDCPVPVFCYSQKKTSAHFYEARRRFELVSYILAKVDR